MEQLERTITETSGEAAWKGEPALESFVEQYRYGYGSMDLLLELLLYVLLTCNYRGGRFALPYIL